MRTHSLLGAFVVMVAVAGVGCDKPAPPPAATPAAPLGYIPKCPEHPFKFEVAQRDSTEAWVKLVLTEIQVSGELTSIVEVHDCQRLIVTTPAAGAAPASRSYGPTATIFASNTLNTMSAAPVRAAAAIYSWGEGDDPANGAYASLGISAGWNCLYVFDSGAGAEAMMIPVRSDTACTGRPQREGTRLSVITRPPPAGMKADDIPAVARWEWGITRDGEANVIWIRCGNMACEIGPAGFKPEPDLPTDVVAGVLAAMGDSKESRSVLQFKGWYDQQILAVLDGGELQVGGAPATLIPWPNLGKMNSVEDFNGWKPVALAYLPDDAAGYGEKLNLSKGLNRILMRRGAEVPGESMAKPCKHPPGGDPWLAMVISNSGAKRYFCVHRFEHTLPPDKMPGTVRWQWLRDDESTWIRCPKGCCPIG